jgi:hypothetical protein
MGHAEQYRRRMLPTRTALPTNDGTTRAAIQSGDQFEQDNIRDSHVSCQHRFDLILRPHAIDNSD